MKKNEVILGSVCLVFGAMIMTSGLINQVTNLAFLIGLSLVPVNALLATDLYSRSSRYVNNFSLREFFTQDSAMFFITLGSISILISLTIFRGIFGL